MEYQFDYGHAVRVIRNVRNDGTYPGLAMGTLLVRRGTVGYVQSYGTFLQDQIIYSVHFIDAGRVVGCREEELIDAEDPWIPSLYEFRDKVTPKMSLAIGGEVVATPGEVGEIMRVLRQENGDVAYELLINQRVFAVPEAALTLVSSAFAPETTP